MGPTGLMSTLIFGTVHVTDHHFTSDVNLGVLERLIPADKAREVVSTRLLGTVEMNPMPNGTATPSFRPAPDPATSPGCCSTY